VLPFLKSKLGVSFICLELDRFSAALARANANRILDFANNDFAIADTPGMSGLLNGFDSGI
jgi:hypothetical protein